MRLIYDIIMHGTLIRLVCGILVGVYLLDITEVCKPKPMQELLLVCSACLLIFILFLLLKGLGGILMVILCMKFRNAIINNKR